jgi:TRAP-type C4-dicarboxylate transport system permease small subunit
MTEVSLGLIGVLLVVGIVINVQQSGHASRATILGYVPRGIYLVVAIISWIVISLRNRKQ